MKDSILYNEAEIKGKLKSMSLEIDRLAKSHPTERVVVIGILNGAIMVLGDLMRYCRAANLQFDTIALRSYTGMFEKQKVKVLKEPVVNLDESIVILIDDIIDTGDTMRFAESMLRERYPKIQSVLTGGLLIRQSCPQHIDFSGFTVADGLWVYGYGLDNYDADRNLPHIKFKREDKSVN